jgi:hypothetical protein
MEELEDEWEQFNDELNDSDADEVELYKKSEGGAEGGESCAPTPSAIYISTKTLITYLDIPANLNLSEIFWKIPIIPYSAPINGVIKKQIKFNSNTVEELNYIRDQIESIGTSTLIEELVISSINKPTGKVLFKDVRKVSIGLCKKDILSYRCKQKSAFYNCFVVIIRINNEGVFKEYHVKVFNTGKLEIPGIQTDKNFEDVQKNILEILQPHIEYQVMFKPISITVLINSNFNCGFYINREVFYDILKFKYRIQCIYEPCSYPGIQCKFYYTDMCEDRLGIKLSGTADQKEVSFMIFRTGSILIVGMCEEAILQHIYEFIKNILVTEYSQIYQPSSTPAPVKLLKKKKRKKIIIISSDA